MAFALTERLMDTLANVTTAGRVAVALIDDAERLTDEHFLELHRITDMAAKRQCPFELLLVGGPKLPDRFDAPHKFVRIRLIGRLCHRDHIDLSFFQRSATFLFGPASAGQ